MFSGIDFETASGWALAVLLVLMMFTGLIEPKRSVNEKIRILEKQNSNLEESVVYLRQANASLTESVRAFADLTRNTNQVVTSIASVARDRN